MFASFEKPIHKNMVGQSPFKPVCFKLICFKHCKLKMPAVLPRKVSSRAFVRNDVMKSVICFYFEVVKKQSRNRKGKINRKNVLAFAVSCFCHKSFKNFTVVGVKAQKTTIGIDRFVKRQCQRKLFVFFDRTGNAFASLVQRVEVNHKSLYIKFF